MTALRAALVVTSQRETKAREKALWYKVCDRMYLSIMLESLTVMAPGGQDIM